MKNLKHTDIHEAFEMVIDKDDWKESIAATINAEYKDIVDYAIEFFTGTKPCFWPVYENGKIV